MTKSKQHMTRRRGKDARVLSHGAPMQSLHDTVQYTVVHSQHPDMHYSVRDAESALQCTHPDMRVLCHSTPRLYHTLQRPTHTPSQRPTHTPTYNPSPVRRTVLQGAAACCRVLQGAAVCRSVSQWLSSWNLTTPRPMSFCAELAMSTIESSMQPLVRKYMDSPQSPSL